MASDRSTPDHPASGNRLAGETSPYLLQHAHNPVDWHPWGAEALERARVLSRPIFLSIGYAACHWCHVMERESFEDDAVAAQLNAAFVAIKVDREERPDLDSVYMEAVQRLTGSGGWPMSVFLTPDGKPFYGGTYFPDRPRHGLPSFSQVLGAVEDAWRTRRDDVLDAASRLTAGLQPPSGGPGERALLDEPALDRVVDDVDAAFDHVNGGWGRAPKFPQPMTIEFLLRRARAAGDQRALAVARSSLDRMAGGGIHDQLGGGFHRYATDATWLVPHFEKMLYDNAQLARVYLHAYELTGDRAYRAVAIGTLDYVAREMVVADGGFAASQDADTDGVEGATFTWTAPDVARALVEADMPEAVTLLELAYDVTVEGNWEGRTILRRVLDDEAVAARTGRSPGEVQVSLAEARAVLHAARQLRHQPGRDDKVLAAWNGLALAAFGDAIRVLDREGDPAADRYRRTAVAAARAVTDGLVSTEGRVRRSLKDGRALHAGTLEDHVHLADGLLALYAATFDERWFTTARLLVDAAIDHFGHPDGGFFDTADDAESLVARPRSLYDNAVPSGNAMAATVLLQVGALTGEARYRSIAEATLALVTHVIDRAPTAFGQWLAAADLAAGPIDEVAIVGSLEDARTIALIETAGDGWRPRQVLAVTPDPGSSAVPLMRERIMLEGRPTAYVCRGFACQRPVVEPEALAAQLAGR